MDKPSLTIRPSSIKKKESLSPSSVSPHQSIEMVSFYIACQAYHGRPGSTLPRGGKGRPKPSSVYSHANEIKRSSSTMYDDFLEGTREGENPFAPRLEHEPPPPPPRFGWRYENQRDDDTPEEHLVRQSLERWKFFFSFSAFMIVAFNISVAICNIKEIPLPFPIGFIPIPFFIVSIHGRMRRSNQLNDMKRERENKEIQSFLDRAVIRNDDDRRSGPDTETFLM